MTNNENWLEAVYTDKTKEEPVKFRFNTKPTLQEKAVFVATVSDAVVADHYLPFIKNEMIDFSIIGLFTDIDVSYVYHKDVDDPDEATTLDKIEEFLERTDAVGFVKWMWPEGLYEELVDAVDADIAFKSGVRVSKTEQALTSLLTSAQKIVDAINVEGLNKAMEGLPAIANITADDIVQAYIDNQTKEKE